jgi:hypothetical protein
MPRPYGCVVPGALIRLMSRANLTLVAAADQPCPLRQAQGMPRGNGAPGTEASVHCRLRLHLLLFVSECFLSPKLRA